MRSRSLVVALFVVLCPDTGGAQERRPTPVVAILWPGSSDVRAQPDAFFEGMRTLGYVDGQNVIYIEHWGRGSEETLPALARDLVARQPDVIVAAGARAVNAVRAANADVPVVVPFMSELIGTGMVDSLASPGGNVTGLTGMSAELGAKRLELLKDVLPALARVAVVWNSSVNKEARWAHVEAASRSLGVTLLSAEVADESALDAAFVQMATAKIDAAMVFNDRFTAARRARIVALAARHRLPTIYDLRQYPEAGGLMSYGPDVLGMYRRSAVFVDKILRGAKPGELPIEQPARIELVINMATARALGLAIPSSFLARADEVIE